MHTLTLDVHDLGRPASEAAQERSLLCQASELTVPRSRSRRSRHRGRTQTHGHRRDLFVRIGAVEKGREGRAAGQRGLVPSGPCSAGSCHTLSAHCLLFIPENTLTGTGTGIGTGMSMSSASWRRRLLFLRMISPALSAPRSPRVRSWGSGLRLHRPPATCVTFATAVLPWRCRPPVQPQRQLGERPGQAACSDLRTGHQTRAHSPG